MRADYSGCVATRNAWPTDDQRNMDVGFVRAFFAWRKAVLRNMVALPGRDY